MIDNYNDVMSQWGCCDNTVLIEPDKDLRRWAVQQTIMVLADADNYYTKEEVDELLSDITVSGVTREEVEQMISDAVASKANQSDLESLASQVSANTISILNRYTKAETDELLSKYAKIEGNTLILNA